MMRFEYWHEGLIFIGCFLVMVGFPCLMVGFLGPKLIDEIGTWPTKAAQAQMRVIVPLLLVEVVSFCMLAAFFQFFSD
ncbi:MAG: hypothetical protein HQL21_05550 [Candidatus Omnitrophica bacterium]|nr:hypothetical protein [Candidatus Omnitrophota bacterium]